jgi:hypothetical protein
MKKKFVFLAAPALVFSTYALAIDYPDMKDGLWSTSATMTGQPPHTGQMCNSSAVFKAMRERAKAPNSPCKPTSEDMSGSTLTVQVTCNFGGTIKKSTNVTTFSGNTAAHTEVHGDDGKLQMVTDTKYIGACPAGMVPGDYVDSSGMKMNMLNPAAPPSGPAGKPPGAP